MDLENQTLTRIASALEIIAAALERQPNPIAPIQLADLPAGVARGNEITFHATTITVSIDEKGAYVYRAKGDRFQKFGVRIWDEILPVLGIDPATLKPGPNSISLQLRAACAENGSPKKIIGLA